MKFLNISITKQQVLQAVVASIAVTGAIITAIPQFTPLLPEKYQPLGVSILGVAIALEKALIVTNQILVGPQKVQSAATQDNLNSLPAATATPPPTNP